MIADAPVELRHAAHRKSTAPVPSREVIARARAGDHAAFAVIVDHFRSPIWNYLYRRFGNAEDANDLAQDTFVKALLAISRTDADLRLGPWLYRIATNVALDRWRHESLVRWESLDRSPGAGAGLGAYRPFRDADQAADAGVWGGQHGHRLVDGDRQDDPEQATLDAELAAAVRRALAHVQPRYRVFLELQTFHQLSYDEIADHFGTTRAAVKSILFRARQAFRRHWQACTSEAGLEHIPARPRPEPAASPSPRTVG